ncbi:MAG TPA: ATP-dependent DNA helicase RecG [Acidimicrobiales bacterium]|nr:ATP-dependent DNA helicase RecG [Acidimicrobiales bacterium]
MSGRRLRTLDGLAVSELKAVTPRKVPGLRALGIETVLDLLMHYPRRYVDRTNQAEIASLSEGDEGVVTAKVVRTSQRRLRGGRSTAEIVLHDGSASLTCTFFNQGWRAKQFSEGQEVTVFGKLRLYRGQRQMANPVIDLVGDQTGRIVPIYRQSGKANVSSVELARYVGEALERAGPFAEPVPAPYLKGLGLVDRSAAFGDVHVPADLEAKEAARRRLAFDELLRLQLLLVRKKRAVAASAVGLVHDIRADGLVAEFVDRLPFELTGAQRRAIATIAEDLALPHPMNRLLQGDVGSGKTVVAVAAMLYGVQGGHQGAFMAPTEVLADQHFLSVRRLLEGLVVPDSSRLGGERPLGVELLTSRTTTAERSRVLGELGAGQLDIIVGTHALLTEDVSFRSLGVVVVDEQHRFGVEQRAALAEKGRAEPDLLVMTATPIPRTAAMTVYGDLDHTTLDEMPPGRTPITTRLLRRDQEQVAWKRLRAELDAGHQAYVVCPLVGGGAMEEEGFEPEDLVASDDGTDDGTDEGSEDGPDAESDGPRSIDVAGRLAIDLDAERPPPRSAVEERDRLAASELSGYTVGLLHGQLASKDKDGVMAAFRAGQIQVLVATTVVEVGVDVTNATVMVIEDADRFGIAQLHQLRGRVGRGEAKSYCLLLADPATDLAAGRLEAIVRTENGFELAEADLDLRGEGTVLGARQKGRTDLKIASLRRHRDLVMKAREVATAILDDDPGLSDPEYQLLWDEVSLFVSEEERQFLFRS